MCLDTAGQRVQAVPHPAASSSSSPWEALRECLQLAGFSPGPCPSSAAYPPHSPHVILASPQPFPLGHPVGTGALSNMGTFLWAHRYLQQQTHKADRTWITSSLSSSLVLLRHIKSLQRHISAMYKAVSMLHKSCIATSSVGDAQSHNH